MCKGIEISLGILYISYKLIYQEEEGVLLVAIGKECDHLSQNRSCGCAVFGHHPMRFAWGFDEEDDKCRELKTELLQQIMTLRQRGVTRFFVVADCGIGLYAGEMLNVLREQDAELQLFCITPHEEQAAKWTPALRDRYFDLLAKCTHMEAASLHKTPMCEWEAYFRAVDYADIVLAVYDPWSAHGGAADCAMLYAERQSRQIILIHPDTLSISSVNVRKS